MIGRPPIEITDELCEKAESLAAQGLTQEQIALVLGMGRTTLYEKKTEFTDFSDAIKKGQAQGIDAVTNKLFEKAREGDNTSMIFYLKNRAGWKDKTETEHTGPGGGPIRKNYTIKFIHGNLTDRNRTSSKTGEVADNEG